MRPRPPSSRPRRNRSSPFQWNAVERVGVPVWSLRVAQATGSTGATRYRLELVDADGLYLTLDDHRGSDTVTRMTTTRKLAPFVIYLRCSTTEQARSGLGLDAQLAACRAYVREQGGRIVEEITEVESGSNDDRPGLARAMAMTARVNGTLVVAKLDRLGRSVAKVATVLKSGLKVRVAESPEASTLELHLRAVVAEEERRAIAARTTAALAEARRRGVKLGSAREGHWQGREEARRRGSLAGSVAAAMRRRERSAGLLEQARPILAATEGQSLRAQAQALEAAGVLTPSGQVQWTATGVKRLRALLAS